MIGSGDRINASDLAFKAELTLKRLEPRLNELWLACEAEPGPQIEFERRLSEHWPALFAILYQLYSHRYDFFYHLEQILTTAVKAWIERPVELRELDRRRTNQPDWFQSEKVVGGALYVDLFSENLARARDQVDYFKDLGLTYLHLMPLFAVRPGDNDGGYAISNYRSVDPRLGTIDDLRMLSQDLHKAGIVLVLDFVFNHTSDDHAWGASGPSRRS
jgi:amylosucrase